jgi:hypothetical protein
MSLDTVPSDPQTSGAGGRWDRIQSTSQDFTRAWNESESDSLSPVRGFVSEAPSVPFGNILATLGFLRIAQNGPFFDVLI